jgi:site-specific DNA recombinase
MPRRAAVYARISQDRAGAGLGVERQEADCRTLADTLGWTITSVHVDNDTSAYSGKKRPGYRALLRELEAGTVDAVLVWHTDRLHRSTVELEEYIGICEPRGIPTHTVQAGNLDLATPSGRMVARMLGAAARYELEHKSARTKRSQSQAAADGKWLGGARPFGWDLRDDGTATLNPAQAAELRNAAEQVLAGASLGSIVRDLNERGVTTGRGGAWNYTSLRQVLRRSRNAGITTLNGVEVGRAQWPAILEEETWRAVVAVLDDPTRRTTTVSNKARYLLAGLAVCGRDGCGAPMRSASSRSGVARKLVRLYRCSSTAKESGHASRRVEPLDEYVTEVIRLRLDRGDVRELVQPKTAVDRGALHVEAEALRARLTEAGELFAAGEISKGQLSTITTTVNAKLADVTARIARATRSNVLDGLLTAVSPGERWADWTVEQRRRVLPYLLTVVVLPGGAGGHRFRPDLVRLDWVSG